MASRALKRLSVMSLLCLSLALCMEGVAHGQSKAYITKIMQDRLESTEELMAGLAINDWSRIEHGTDALLKATQPVGWQGPLKRKLDERDDALRSAIKTLSTFVDGKNGDGARLIFIQVVTLCMDCHNLEREFK